MPFLAVANSRGEIFEARDYLMAGMELDRPVLPDESDLIPLPYGSNLYVLPGRTAIGWDPRQRRFVAVREVGGEPVSAAAAFMAPAYLQLARAAAEPCSEGQRLPLYSYTAVGWRRGGFYVAGTRIDADLRQDLTLVNLNSVEKAAGRMLARYPGNRLVEHLVEKCVRCYNCPAARNFVLERWECPVPTSRTCNAGCVGCISWQPETTGVPASQDRLAFTPSPEEIAQFVVPHLETAPRPVASFGQGCEGEPLLAGHVIEAAIRLIRRRTDRGVINMNTNASRPDVIERLALAGLDSIRVSLNSAPRALVQPLLPPAEATTWRPWRSRCAWRGATGCGPPSTTSCFRGSRDREDETEALERLVRDRR